MNTRRNRSILILLAFVPFLLACMFVTGLVQKPKPKMETDPNTVIQVLNGRNWVRLEALAAETYTDADYAKPGTLTFTAKVANDVPVYFSYGWCAVDETTLSQNFGHITVALYFNGEQLGNDVVHNFSYGLVSGLVCGEYGVLMSDWPAGEYHLKAVATFDSKINDGMADYDAGDYIFDYNVKVDQQGNPSPSP